MSNGATLDRAEVKRRNPYIMEVKMADMVQRMRRCRKVFVGMRGFVRGIPVYFCEHQGRISLWPRP